MMRLKMIRLLLSLLLLPAGCPAQVWTPEQLEAANTAGNVAVLSETEREVLLYLNLARLYPQQFAEQEVAGYTAKEFYGDQLVHSKYRQSLMQELHKMKPAPALLFDPVMYALAACFARESGQAGIVGHERRTCKGGYGAECCSYGMQDARGIVLQWLIDEDIASLGHRKICLDPTLRYAGIATGPHPRYRYCAVADFNR